jgi:hypothetical protein
MNLLVVYVKQLPTLDDVEGNEQVFAYSPTLGRNVRISVDTLRRGEGTPIWSQNDANDGELDRGKQLRQCRYQ